MGKLKRRRVPKKEKALGGVHTKKGGILKLMDGLEEKKNEWLGRGEESGTCPREKNKILERKNWKTLELTKNIIQNGKIQKNSGAVFKNKGKKESEWGKVRVERGENGIIRPL